jgi:hypothetical protein
MQWSILLWLVAALATVSARERANSPRPSSVARVEGLTAGAAAAAAVQVDGALAEEVWRQASVIRDFLQREPEDGAPATFATSARVVYDSTAIYVAIEASDPDPSKIASHLTRRDSNSPSDWVSVAIDSYHDRRTAFEFSVNPAGVKRDKYLFGDGNGEDLSWDAVWDVAVTTHRNGWTAEFRIPFSQLRFRESHTPTVGIAFVRKIGRLNETASWPLLSRSATGYVSSFAELRGLELSRSPKRLEAVPYTVAKLATVPRDPGNPLIDPVAATASVGLDLKYAVTPGLTLTATANPDFGQVEADPAVVNLGAFETFYAERRPFFVEGSEVFRTEIDGLFYSRRIGRRPQVGPGVPEGGFVSVPSETTILGATKLTGRVGKFSVGALNAITGGEYATIAAGTDRTQVIAEPPTSYSAVRARRDFDNQSSVGFMATATNRSLTDPVRILPGQAYAGGVDWDWRIKPRYSFTGYWAGSLVLGAAEAIDNLQRNNVHSFQRPDARYVQYDSTRTSLAGQSFQAGLAKIGGERIRFNSTITFKTPGYDLNDLGFMRRADEISTFQWFQWRNDRPSRYFRSVRLSLNQSTGWNFGGDRLMNGGGVNVAVQFTNNWRTSAGFNINATRFDDRLSRGGPGGLRNGTMGLWHSIDTDDRKSVHGGTMFSYQSDRNGSSTFEAQPDIGFRPKPALQLSTGVRFHRNNDDSQWLENVALDRDHYIFGRLAQTTLALTTRINYTITPTLSIQLYAEPFISAGDYKGFKELVDGRAAHYQDRYTPYLYSSNPDFHYTSFRTTNVLRWEYRPGSALFVVWQQGREESLSGRGDFRLMRDFGGIFDAPARNVLLVKLAHWFNF